MPYKWVEPELLLEHKGVKVFHTYNNDEEGDRMCWWYTTSPNELFDADERKFDIRYFLGWSSRKDVCHCSHHKDVIKAAIDNGLITSPEE